jgi:hypothetical protein
MGMMGMDNLFRKINSIVPNNLNLTKEVIERK